MADRSAAAPPLVVVMGVSGSGKSTIGEALAQLLGAGFLEGDALHPPRNVERMAAGVALTDDDRREWLVELAQRLAQARAAQRGLVLSCSALKRSYRDVLRRGCPELRFVHLHTAPGVLEARLRARADHFMPASLLESQLQTLEAPGADENAATFDATLPPETITTWAAQWITDPGAAPAPSATPRS